MAATDSDTSVSDTPLPFTNEQFVTWYESHRHWRLEPACLTFERLVNERLDLELDEFERTRIRVSATRVKDTQRAWKKLQKPQYRSLASDIMNVPEILDDLVGVRIVCNNLSDIQRVKEIIGSLPEFDPDSLTGLAIEGESERFYLDAPKPSGYRAYHINLVTVVPGSDHVHPMRAELQVRTLLQDGWGELTHEDTYKAVQSSRLLR